MGSLHDNTEHVHVIRAQGMHVLHREIPPVYACSVTQAGGTSPAISLPIFPSLSLFLHVCGTFTTLPRAMLNGRQYVVPGLLSSAATAVVNLHTSPKASSGFSFLLFPAARARAPAELASGLLLLLPVRERAQLVCV